MSVVVIIIKKNDVPNKAYTGFILYTIINISVYVITCNVTLVIIFGEAGRIIHDEVSIKIIAVANLKIF